MAVAMAMLEGRANPAEQTVLAKALGQEPAWDMQRAGTRPGWRLAEQNEQKEQRGAVGSEKGNRDTDRRELSGL